LKSYFFVHVILIVIYFKLCFSRYNKKQKAQDKDLVSQGLNLPHTPASATPLPPALSRPQLAIPAQPEMHRYILPRNMAGQVKNPRKVAASFGSLEQYEKTKQALTTSSHGSTEPSSSLYIH
jgi:hypothetical protein